MPMLFRIAFAVFLLAATARGDQSAPREERALSQFVHRTWRTDDGLPNGVVRSIAQTRDRYMWIATYDGLARFNGQSFARFDRGTRPALPHNTILTLTTTRDGALWAGTNGGGLTRLDGETSRTWTTADGLPSNVVYSIVEAPDGALWIGTNGGGVSRFEAGRFRTFGLRAGLTSLSIVTMLMARDGSLFVGTNGGGLNVIRDGRVLSIRHSDGLPSDVVFSLFEESDGSILAGCGGGLARIRGDRVTLVTTPGLPADNIMTILRDRAGALWIGTYGTGLYRSTGGAFETFSSHQGLLNDSVRSLFEDAEGTVWVGSNGGVETFARGRFVAFGPGEGLSDPYIRSVFEDRQSAIWFGTARGLNRMDGTGAITQWTRRDGLASDYIFSMAETPDGAMWIGTPAGLHRMQNGRFTHYTTKDGLCHNSTRTLFVDREGLLWIGTDAGLNTFDGRVFRHLLPDARWQHAYVQPITQAPDGTVWIGSDGSGLAGFKDGEFRILSAGPGHGNDQIFALLAGGHGTLWIGTDGGGLIRMRHGRFAKVTMAHGLPSDKILQLLDDGHGNLWIGTGRGLVMASERDLDAVADAGQGRLRLESFTRGDGLRTTQFNGSAHPVAIRSRDGRLWFATTNGAAMLDPRLMSGESAVVVAPRLVIESVAIDGRRSRSAQTTPRAAQIVMPPEARDLEVSWAALTFVAPERLRFSYKLDGFDREWIDAGNRQVAYYTNLPPGTYRFHVVTRDAAENSGAGASLPIRVEAHFWESPLLPLAVALTLMAGAYLIHLWRVRTFALHGKELAVQVEARTREILDEKVRTERALAMAERERGEAQRLERLAHQALEQTEAASRAKSLFLAKMSHELRTPLNAIIGFGQVLEDSRRISMGDRERTFLRNITTSGQYLLGVINDILDLAKIEAGKMTFEPESLVIHDSLKTVAGILRGVVMSRGIRLELDVAPDLGMVEADPVKFKQIVHNLVSNAVKFSPDHSVVRIAARCQPADQSPLGVDSLAVSVSDLGVGIAAGDHAAIFEEFHQVGVGRTRPQGTGLGLALVRKFVDIHRGCINVASELGHGSVFTFTIPMRATVPESADELPMASQG